MNLTLIVVFAAMIISAVWLYQLFMGELSLFTVGLTFLIVSATCSGVGFIKGTAKNRSEFDQQQ